MFYQGEVDIDLNPKIGADWMTVYTGVRHGELVALAWEDMDLQAGTMVIRRNHTLTKEFTLPKTEAGTNRTI